MRQLSYLLLALLLALGPALRGDDMTGSEPPKKAPTYFDPATFDPKSVLAGPQPDNSDATEKELEIILQDQASRTREQVARINQEEHYHIFLFANVLGSWFNNETVGASTATNKVLASVMETAKPILDAAKADWNRKRPFVVNSRVYPSVERPTDSSYPSGHAARAELDGLVLSQLDPGDAQAIMARAQQIGDDRVIAGVHFPSDTEAGRKLGRAIFDRLMAEEGFQDELKAAQKEVADEMKKAR